MINLNYLGHSFKLSRKYNMGEDADYVCEHCNVLVWYRNDNDIFWFNIPDYWIKLKLSCNEMIIKNIIE